MKILLVKWAAKAKKTLYNVPHVQFTSMNVNILLSCEIPLLNNWAWNYQNIIIVKIPAFKKQKALLRIQFLISQFVQFYILEQSSMLEALTSTLNGTYTYSKRQKIIIVLMYNRVQNREIRAASFAIIFLP